MLNQRDKSLLIREMKALLDELCAPDLTITRANTLRPELARLMDSLHEAGEPAGAERPWPQRKETTAPRDHPFVDLLTFPAPYSLRSVG